jgi:hypothetical protein
VHHTGSSEREEKQHDVDDVGSFHRSSLHCEGVGRPSARASPASDLRRFARGATPMPQW